MTGEAVRRSSHSATSPSLRISINSILFICTKILMVPAAYKPLDSVAIIDTSCIYILDWDELDIQIIKKNYCVIISLSLFFNSYLGVWLGSTFI